MTAPDLTHDSFLGGALRIWQPSAGYRAATDPVFLAAACPAGPGAQVLDLGCGVGVAGLCLSKRVADLKITGVERQARYANLARRNATEAGLFFEVVEADLTDLPPDLRRRSFDHVIANPPFFPADAGTPARDAGREAALREETPLDGWISAARARLKPKGWLTLIQTTDRLPNCLTAMAKGFGSISVMPLQPRRGRPSHRVLIRARKGGRAPFQLLPPLLIHRGDRHDRDAPDFTESAEAVLRHSAAIPWP